MLICPVLHREVRVVPEVVPGWGLNTGQGGKQQMQRNVAQVEAEGGDVQSQLLSGSALQPCGWQGTGDKVGNTAQGPAQRLPGLQLQEHPCPERQSQTQF